MKHQRGGGTIFCTLTIHPGYKGVHENVFINTNILNFFQKLNFPLFLESNSVATTNLSYFSVVPTNNFPYFPLVPTTNFSYISVTTVH